MEFERLRRLLATVFDTAVEADTDILDPDVSAKFPPAILRVQVASDTAAVFKAVITRGGSPVTVEFNSGAPLAADGLYTFDLGVEVGDSVNFQLSAGATVLVMNVDELAMGYVS